MSSAELQLLNDKLAKLTEENEALSRQNLDFRDQLLASKNKYDALEIEHQSLKRDKEYNENKMIHEDLTTRLLQYEDVNQDQSTKIVELRLEIGKKIEEIFILSSKMDGQTVNFKEHEKQLNKYKTLLKTSQAENTFNIEQLKKEIELLTNINQLSMDSLKDEKKKSHNLEELIKELNNLHSAEKKNLEEKLNSLQVERHNLHITLSLLREELHAIHAQLEILPSLSSPQIPDACDNRNVTLLMELKQKEAEASSALLAEKLENRRLNNYLNLILEELEQKAPALAQLTHQMDLLREENRSLSLARDTLQEENRHLSTSLRLLNTSLLPPTPSTSSSPGSPSQSSVNTSLSLPLPSDECLQKVLSEAKSCIEELVQKNIHQSTTINSLVAQCELLRLLTSNDKTGFLQGSLEQKIETALTTIKMEIDSIKTETTKEINSLQQQLFLTKSQLADVNLELSTEKSLSDSLRDRFCLLEKDNEHLRNEIGIFQRKNVELSGRLSQSFSRAENSKKIADMDVSRIKRLEDILIRISDEKESLQENHMNLQLESSHLRNKVEYLDSLYLSTKASYQKKIDCLSQLNVLLFQEIESLKSKLSNTIHNSQLNTLLKELQASLLEKTEEIGELKKKVILSTPDSSLTEEERMMEFLNSLQSYREQILRLFRKGLSNQLQERLDKEIVNLKYANFQLQEENFQEKQTVDMQKRQLALCEEQLKESLELHQKLKTALDLVYIKRLRARSNSFTTSLTYTFLEKTSKNPSHSRKRKYKKLHKVHKKEGDEVKEQGDKKGDRDDDEEIMRLKKELLEARSCLLDLENDKAVLSSQVNHLRAEISNMQQKAALPAIASNSTSSRQQIISSLLSQYPSLPSSSSSQDSSSSSLSLFFPRANPNKQDDLETDDPEKHIKIEIDSNLNSNENGEEEADSDPWTLLNEEDIELEITKLKIELTQLKKEKENIKAKLDDSVKILDKYKNVVSTLVASQGTILPFPLHPESPLPDIELAEWLCKFEHLRASRLKNEILQQLSLTSALLKGSSSAVVNPTSSNEFFKLSQLNRALKHENFKLRALKIQYAVLKQEDTAKALNIENLKTTILTYEERINSLLHEKQSSLFLPPPPPLPLLPPPSPHLHNPPPSHENWKTPSSINDDEFSPPRKKVKLQKTSRKTARK